MNVGMFGYPGPSLERLQALVNALKAEGAEQLICLGGFVGAGSEGDNKASPINTLRWLRSVNIPVLANDMDQQIAEWRTQSVRNVTGYVQPGVRYFLNNMTRDEGIWLSERPAFQAFGNVLCCSGGLSIATYPTPRSAALAERLFSAMRQKVAFFPDVNGPSALVTRDGNTIEAQKYEMLTLEVDHEKIAAIIGGVAGAAPINHDVAWGAVADDAATRFSLVCLDAKTLQRVPERGALLVQQAKLNWK